MTRFFSARPRVNKRNGQINISIPKRKLSKKSLRRMVKGTKVRFKIMGYWED